jgi:membrane protein insertase Oxa1/YidC/SpoIIIJ
MSHWIIYSLLIYVIYKLVKGVVFPAMQITNTVNGKMREMQNKMKDMEQEQQKQQQRQSRKKEGEYIDYEEVK